MKTKKLFRFQFSLLSILLLTTIVAVIIGWVGREAWFAKKVEQNKKTHKGQLDKLELVVDEAEGRLNPQYGRVELHIRHPNGLDVANIHSSTGLKNTPIPHHTFQRSWSHFTTEDGQTGRQRQLLGSRLSGCRSV